MSDGPPAEFDAFEGTVVATGPTVLDDGVDTVTLEADPLVTGDSQPAIGERYSAVGRLVDDRMEGVTLTPVDQGTATYDELAKDLAAHDLLTERQAEAFLLREVEHVPRKDAARAMGISANTLDKHISRARQRVDAARNSLRTINRASDLLDDDTDE